MAENERTPTAGAGGFLVPSLPSPAPTNTSTRSTTGLPHPRSRALASGTVKENKVRTFVDERMRHIGRRFAKRAGLPVPGDDAVGYKSMGELCKDLGGLIDILWLSGTPRLQVPYLLNVANELNTWVTAFPPSPTATFSILHKLDHCFASLLTGQDIETKESLPGFENGLRAGFTRTDMVRCKSLVEQTRVIIVDVMSKEPDDEDDADEADGPMTADETESGADDAADQRRGLWDEDEDDIHMDVARVYEHTLVRLGETLGDGLGVGEIQMSDICAPFGGEDDD